MPNAYRIRPLGLLILSGLLLALAGCGQPEEAALSPDAARAIVSLRLNG